MISAPPRGNTSEEATEGGSPRDLAPSSRASGVQPHSGTCGKEARRMAERLSSGGEEEEEEESSRSADELPVG